MLTLDKLRTSCNVVKNIDDAIKSNKPDAYLTAIKYAVLCKKANELVDKYVKEYETKLMLPGGFYNDKYAVYYDVIDGYKVFNTDCYKEPTTHEEFLTPFYKRPLKDECQKLVDEGKVIPSRDLYVKLNVELQLPTPDEISKEDIVKFGATAFDILTTRIADHFYNLIQQIIADKPDVTQELKERYNAKLELAKAYLNNKDANAERVLSISAKILGISVEDYAKRIVEAAEKWTNLLDYYATLIDEYRIAVKTVFYKDPFAAIDILKKAKDLTTESSEEDVIAIFKEHGFMDLVS